MNCCNAQSSVDYYTCHSGSNYFANATNCADKNPTLCLSLFPRGAPSTLAPLGMRNFKCRDPALYDMALECASTCYACCLRSTYTCGDSPGKTLTLKMFIK
uniref:Uncharacterized protein n=1 Tax=Panagrolaimus davidi TaxID=227884 RepID=A0A914PHZ8_9BILA